MELLLEAGAKDVFYEPIYMKKNRPAWLLSVICEEATAEQMERIIFQNTTTIGIRHLKMQRTVMERRMDMVSTTLGKVRVKECHYENITKRYPEYDDIRQICRQRDIGFSDAYARIRSEIQIEEE